ncbi:MAG: leucine-rich repeat domain-containing protein, partial [Simkaniaceae bacterium]|nr:leucine-rich repeat domain-containing protein [Simkaniaceae bacterium]
MASSIQQTTLPIPDEIARAILSYVLDPSVELVCKSWRALSQSLVQTQLRSFSEVTSEDPTNNKAKEIFIAIFRERNRLIPEDARRSYDGFPFISCARYKFVYWDVKEAYRFLDSELLRNRRTCKFVCNLPTRGDLPELQSLTLDVHNLFGFAPELPVDLPRCAALRKLTIEDDKRHSTVFPPIEDLRPRFICESRAVSPFQDQLGVLPLLTHLSLRTLQLGVIPTDIGSFDALTFLDLSGNELTYLPKEVGKLSSLKKLFLHSNDFEQFPPSILQLTSLEGLLLFGNHLTGIPFEISKLSHLQSLNLSSNNITVLPSSLGV